MRRGPVIGYGRTRMKCKNGRVFLTTTVCSPRAANASCVLSRTATFPVPHTLCGYGCRVQEYVCVVVPASTVLSHVLSSSCF